MKKREVKGFKNAYRPHKNGVVIYLVIVAVSIFFLLSYYFNVPRDINASDALIDLYRNSEIHVVDYIVEGDTYTPVSNDPQLYVSCDIFGLEYKYVHVVFAEPLEKDTLFQLYYPYDHQLSEVYSITKALYKGDREVTLEIPYYDYEYLRFDLNGRINIAAIYLSDSADSIERTSYDYVLVIIFFNVLALIALFYMQKYGILERFSFTWPPPWLTKRLAYGLGGVLLSAIVAFLAELVIGASMGDAYFIAQRFLFVWAVLLSACSIALFRKSPEKTFLLVSVIIGTLYAVTIPIPYVSWDEEIHYMQTIKQSSFDEYYLTYADVNVRDLSIEAYYYRDTRENELTYMNEALNRTLLSINKKDIVNFYALIGYTPAAIGLFIGRGLGLTWSAVFILGRLSSLYAYLLIVYAAMRRLKTGKYIAAVLALMPTPFFLGANYSYDSWVMAWILFGTAYWLSEMQQPDKKLTPKDQVVMIGAFVVGLGPKAIYFPIMLILFLIGKEKFASISQYRQYRKNAALSILFVVLTFMIPFIFSGGGGVGDLRGGEGVNASEQTQYILTNPLAYAKTLFVFLQGYLSLERTSEYTVFFAYMGHIGNHILLLVTLAGVVFTDKNKFDVLTSTVKLKAIMFFIGYITMALAATSLYISFTAVGSDTILGCQSRYILPMLFPVLIMVGSGRIENNMNKSVYTAVVFGACSYVLLSGLWQVCIANYQ